MQTKRDDIANNAVSEFLSGYNCAESVLLTMARHKDRKSLLIPKIATPFGRGMGRSGSICGYVTGALMYIGTRYGRTKLTDKREKAYILASNFMDVFERKFGSLMCYDLVGCDFRTPA